jgi:hypothetical protein
MRFVLILILGFFTLGITLSFVLLMQSSAPLTGLATQPNGPSTVTRVITPATVNGGETITITLTLSVLNDETFYAMEEYVPQGFVVQEPIPGGGVFDAGTNTIRWYYLDVSNPETPIPASESPKTYTVTAPGSTGQYEFSGIFEFEDDPASAAIAGDIDVTVGSCTSECTNDATQCQGNGVQTCSDTNGDGCFEWGTAVSCGTPICTADMCIGATYIDRPLLDSASQSSCTNTCTNGICNNCAVTSCTAFTETCTAANECNPTGSIHACGGTTRKCVFTTTFGWVSTPAAETQCADSHDNDCNDECDYDSQICTHGDTNCKVQLGAIQVSDATPVENSLITVTCTANAPSLNSITVDIDGTVCTSTPVWNGNDISYSCNVGAYQATLKTVRCTVDLTKSYQEGTNPTTTITLEQSPCTGLDNPTCSGTAGCEWCTSCDGTKFSGFATDQCVPQGGCTHTCTATQCAATCDLTTVCTATACDSVCQNTTALLFKPDVANTCQDDCSCTQLPADQCSAGTIQECGVTTCAATFPGQHLVGNCINTCADQTGDDSCQSCTPTFTGGAGDSCACESGWTNADGNFANGCEAEVQTCNLSWSCGDWSSGTCGDRTCTCACQGGTGCAGDSTTHVECGSSPIIFKGGGSPSLFKGGGSPSLFKGGIPPPPPIDKCVDGRDNEGTPPVVNGCIDERDALCGGTESFCYGGIDNDCDGLIDCDDPDCADNDVCQEQNESQEPPTYSVSDVLDSMITEDTTPSPVDSTTTFKSAADVQVFFGFMNWIVIGILVALFFGLIFVQHIKPHITGRGAVPMNDMDAISTYIVKHHAQGESDDDIKKHLKEVGWIDEVIDDALAKNPQAPSTEPPANAGTAPTDLHQDDQAGKAA